MHASRHGKTVAHPVRVPECVTASRLVSFAFLPSHSQMWPESRANGATRREARIGQRTVIHAVRTAFVAGGTLPVARHSTFGQNASHPAAAAGSPCENRTDTGATYSARAGQLDRFTSSTIPLPDA